MRWSFWKRELPPHKEPEAIEERVQKASVTRLKNQIRRERLDYLRGRLEDLRDQQQEEIMRQQIEDIEADREEEAQEGGADSPDALITSLITRAMQRTAPNTPAPVTTEAPLFPSGAAPATKKSLSDAQIRALIAQIPPFWIKKLQSMTPEQRVQIAREYYPDHFDAVDDDTLVRADMILCEVH